MNMNNGKYSLLNIRNLLMIVMLIVLASSVFAAVTYNAGYLSPANGSYTRNQTLNFTFNASSTTNITLNCTLIIDTVAYGNITAPNDTLTGIVSNATLAEGLHNWYIACNDSGSVGNSGNSTVTVDITSPVITLANISINTSSATPDFTYGVNDSLSPSFNCSLFFNGVSAANNASVQNNTNTHITASTQIDGIYTVSINCTDNATNANRSNEITVKIDTVSPLTTILNASYNTTDTTPTIAFNFTDSLSANANCTLYFNGANVSSNTSVLNNTWTEFTASAQTDGIYSAYVNCTDTVGLVNKSNTITIKIDNGVPTTNIITVSTNTTDDTPSIIFNYTDALSPTANCSIYFNAASAGNNASVLNYTATTITASSQSNGIYTVYVNCTDDMSNIDKSSEITVKIDNSTPTVTISSPTDAEHTYDNTTDIIFTFTDSLSPWARCDVLVNGSGYTGYNATGFNATVWNNTATTITINSTTGLTTDSTYLIKVNCSDDLSNMGSSSSITLYIDRTAPTISAPIPTSTSGTTSTTSSGTATITITSDENATCWYSDNAFNATDASSALSLSGNATTTHSFTKTYTATGNIGPYYLSCRDTAGNNMTSWNSTELIPVSVTTTSTGGGGGGGSTTTNPSTSQSWDKITPGGTSIMKVVTDDFGVKEISINVINQANNVKIVIEKLAGKPASVTQTIEGKVYKYLNIKLTNLDNANIKGMVTVKFQVTQGWLLSNGVKADNIVLKRYANGVWNDLKTILLSTDTKNAYYSAETPGFSYFAIGEKSVAPPAPAQPPAETPAAEETPPAEEPAAEETPPAEEQPPVEKPVEKKPSALASVLIMVVILLAIILIILAITRKKGPKHRALQE